MGSRIPPLIPRFLLFPQVHRGDMIFATLDESSLGFWFASGLGLGYGLGSGQGPGGVFNGVLTFSCPSIALCSVPEHIPSVLWEKCGVAWLTEFTTRPRGVVVD